MRKLTLVLSLFIFSIAFATVGSPDIGYNPVVGGADEITIAESDTVYVDISAYLAGGSDANWLIDTGTLTLTITGNASFIQNTDLTQLNEYDVWYGATLNYAYDDAKTLRIRLGTLATKPDRFLDGWMRTSLLPEILIDHIGIHCDGLGTATVALTVDDDNTSQWGTTRVSPDSAIDPDAAAQEADLEALGGQLIIHQTPEPMTIALLGLGGLFLRRRK